ncbi:DUF6230 family protein [Actinocorallia sp. A-T 12471]|uniref:DUF6230 family protein n=1 Tax=Actinocorallia sp. A-T 12471 TaxID=3089813 RepID=UPI0029D00E4B|nr:DUF6230 family protein [Actinocorallia sp. A-T 12471]MDX6743773.1 DUF6230 family protein [Actinocorallia sp. A-T 12471]
MKHAVTTGSAPTGRVNWKRFGLMMVPAGLVVGAFGFATASGALASSFVISGSNFKVTADKLEGEGFVQYGRTITPTGKGTVPVAVSGIAKAKITNMCQSVAVGPFALRLTAGDAGKPVSATNLVLDVEQLAGDAVFSDMQIGVDASTVSAAGKDIHSDTKGAFGQQAATVVITDLDQTAWSTTAGTFTLPNLKLGFGGSDNVCK